MENHPIPQDVTGFQFKLIGEMTVKQFAYLVAGIILAWITISLPILFLVKVIFALIFLLFGVSFAFLPVEGRPADVMFSYFIKALFASDQYFYQKAGRDLLPQIISLKIQTAKKSDSEDAKKKLQAYLKQLPKKVDNQLDKRETVYFESLSSIFKGQVPHDLPMPEVQVKISQPAPMQPVVTSTNQPLPEEEAPEEKSDIEEEQAKIKQTLEKEALIIQRELAEAKKQETTQKDPNAFFNAHKKVSELESQLQETLKEKEELEKQLLLLQKKIQAQQAVYAPSTATPKQETQNVRKIPKSMANAIGIPIVAEVPNLIAGVVKDPRGNILPNILIEVKDQESNPIRAFKTNGLGQFVSATPLLNGTYTIEFEDTEGKNKFDVIELNVVGEIIQPIEVISHDEREELSKALFNN